MTDIADVFLPAIPPSKKVSTEGEIHVTYDAGKSTMVLVVPNREEVYKVNGLDTAIYEKNPSC